MERLGTALIGLGNVAATHADAWASLPRSRLVGVYDHSVAQVRTFSERYNVRPYSSLDEALDDSAVQIVDVCTPHPTHAGIATRAAGKGRHVLVEKPMAPTLADCDAMIDAASRNGVRLGVISQRRWYEPVQRMHQAISDGKVGNPALGSVTLLGWRGEDYYALAPWRGTWSGEGGGVLVNQASHHLDLFQWLMGPVEDVFGFWANLNHPYIEVEDSAVAALRFASGAIGAIVLSNSQRPGLYGQIHVHGHTGASVGVQTETGSSFVAGVSTRVEPAFNDIWTVPGEEDLLPSWQLEDRERVSQINAMTHYHLLQIQDFLDAVVADRDPSVTGQDGRKTVELFTAIYQSQQERAPVRLPLAG